MQWSMSKIKYHKMAKQAILKVHQHQLDDDDWDQRPSFICKKCGYAIKSCVCSVQKEFVRAKTIAMASIDFY